MALPSVLSRDELSRILSQVEPAQQTDAQTEVRGAQTSTRNALVPSFRFGWDARAARAGPSGPEREARDLKWGGCSALGAVRTVETPNNGAGGRVSARCLQSLLVGAVTGGQAAPARHPAHGMARGSQCDVLVIACAAKRCAASEGVAPRGCRAWGPAGQAGGPKQTGVVLLVSARPVSPSASRKGGLRWSQHPLLLP